MGSDGSPGRTAALLWRRWPPSSGVAVDICRSRWGKQRGQSRSSRTQCPAKLAGTRTTSSRLVPSPKEPTSWSSCEKLSPSRVPTGTGSDGLFQAPSFGPRSPASTFAPAALDLGGHRYLEAGPNPSAPTNTDLLGLSEPVVAASPSSLSSTTIRSSRALLHWLGEYLLVRLSLVPHHYPVERSWGRRGRR